MAFSNETAMRALVGICLCLGLAACESGAGLDGAFGAQDTGVAGAGGTGAGGGRAPAAPRDPAAPLVVGTGANAVEYECPRVTVRNGAATWQVQSRGGGLEMQGTLGQMARECSISGDTMTMKVGIEGRVMLGEQGKPGEVKVPIRIAVVQEGPEPKTIATKFFVMPLTIPAGEGQAGFTVVEDALSFPLVKPNVLERYVVYVGFDPKGQPESRPATRRPKPAASAAPAAQPQPAKPAPAKPAATAPAATAPAQTLPAPKSDVFGPPPDTSGVFGPPPSTFTPPPVQQ